VVVITIAILFFGHSYISAIHILVIPCIILYTFPYYYSWSIK